MLNNVILTLTLESMARGLRHAEKSDANPNPGFEGAVYILSSLSGGMNGLGVRSWRWDKSSSI
eukprot:329587-Amorphochlora_amoeboformis.AAC.1